jgi:APA family basic amino acid/polyamine antiporter
MKFLAQLFRRKTVQELTEAADDEEGRKLNKVLTATDVFNAGVACIIGTGIFVITGVAAHDYAGPGIIVSFLLAGVVCAFVSMAYAELSSMIPVSGSAYTYAYATLGELMAWIIGWDLLLEYAVGSAAVATGWSDYLQGIFVSIGQSPWVQAHLQSMFGVAGSSKPIVLALPDFLRHAPASIEWSVLALATAGLAAGLYMLFKARSQVRAGQALGWLVGAAGLGVFGFGGYEAVHFFSRLSSIDFPAVFIIALLNYWLIKGVKHTARMTSIFVVVKLAVIALFIVVGVTHITPSNWTPFMPMGWQGVFTGASIVFFAYIGFDACTTLSEECVNPQRDVPRGVLGSLAVCTVLYLAVAAILTGIISYAALGPAPMAQALEYIHHGWAANLVSLGAVAGITSVLVVCLVGQSRIMMRMARDGLIAPVFGRVSERFRTPVWSIVICGLSIAIMAGLLPIGELAKLTNIGTLFAFAIVCVGVMILRVTEPDSPRSFRCPRIAFSLGRFRIVIETVWIIGVIGAAMSLWMMYELPLLTQLRFGIWMLIGFVVYFGYSRWHSHLTRRNLDVQNTLQQPPQDEQR